ncbi:hypothetical protein [Mucilaginibacter aquariorum]|uniref:Ig-like domain-containing protein n=1 Tax=Mucilaginibacter aquariorum TaxID=2967225 RepID=A0ABT1T064_9SPHI|nr:hypothetical protein [Mucilaginibacter aquariorum]MCQ6957984.1 hypothetical protein [Mucilaginibacter aquariorum]
MAAQINSKYGVRVIKNDTETSSALVCSDGLSTTVHPTSYVIKNDIIFLCCGRHVYALDIPVLQLKWFKELDPATCIEIYSFEDGFIIHGEISISRVTLAGEIKWEFSARDIFVNLNGHKEFEITGGQIKLVDFENYEYILDANGKVITDRLLK